MAFLEGIKTRAQRLYQAEWQRDANRQANLVLLKAVAFFTGAVIVARNFGEAFAI